MEYQHPNYTYRATVVKVVDGDTIDVDLDVGFDILVRKRLRLIGIDTWEVRGEEREKGLIAKARMQELVDEAEKIYVTTVMDATGKYGRLLAVVWSKDEGQLRININELLLEEGHATKYPS